MATDPDGLFPRRADAASEGVDENREIDDIELTLEEDLLPEEENEDEAEWMIDADQRPVDLDDDEDREAPGGEDELER
ncbi:MAG: hypothetical protein H7311_03340 [Ramlibacter sp.]|nr:hypothetical protein [Cryobacterium sp.]